MEWEGGKWNARTDTEQVALPAASDMSVVVPLSDVSPDMVPILTAIEVKAGEEATIVVNS